MRGGRAKGRRHQPPRGPRFLLALLALSLAGGSIRTARAHSTLVRSQPAANALLSAPPQEIRLWFSETVEAGQAQIRVLDHAGRSLEGGDLRSIPGEATGLALHLRLSGPESYRVLWRMLSRTEGHVTRGGFPFRVAGGEPASAPTAEPLPGTALPGAQVPEPATDASSAAKRGAAAATSAPATSPASTSTTAPPGEAQLRGLVFFLATWLVGGALFGRLVVPGFALPRPLVVAPAALLPLATLGWTAAWALHGAGGVAAGVPELLATRAGKVFLARDLAALAVLAVAALRPGARLLPGLAFLATLSLGAHAAATGDPLAPVLDWAHLVAAAAWAGGLGHLAWLAWRRPPSFPWRPVIRRFSNLALVSVGALAATGLYRAAQELGGWTGLWGTDFGRLLSLKSALAGLALALGGVHLLRWRRGGERDPWRFRSSLAAEACALASVLAVTGLLTTRTPGRLEPATQALRLGDRAGDWRFALELRPGWTGANDVRVRLRPPEPQRAPRRVEIGLAVEPHPGHRVWVVETELARAAPLEFVAATDRLTVPWNRWSAEVRIWPEKGARRVGRVAFALREPADALRPAAPRPPEAALPLVLLLATPAAALGLLRRRQRRRETGAYSAPR